MAAAAFAPAGTAGNKLGVCQRHGLSNGGRIVKCDCKMYSAIMQNTAQVFLSEACCRIQSLDIGSEALEVMPSRYCRRG